MLRLLTGLAPASSLLSTPVVVAEAAVRVSEHSLFVWAGDRDKKGNDFPLVVDADPRSQNFGRMMTSLETDQKTVRPHHTEYTMPASGMLFANDHDAGRTFILDVRDPMQPSVVQSAMLTRPSRMPCLCRIGWPCFQKLTVWSPRTHPCTTTTC
jgi:hypothetical protein